jgi:hypothetical protein
MVLVRTVTVAQTVIRVSAGGADSVTRMIIMIIISSDRDQRSRVTDDHRQHLCQ